MVSTDSPPQPPVQFFGSTIVITVPDAKKGLISEMTSAVRKAVGATEALSISNPRLKTFKELVEVVRAASRADLVLDGYYYMLWELGLLSPVNYIQGGPFETNGAKLRIPVFFAA